MWWYLGDHLGSTDVIAYTAGTIKEESDYYPYGGEIAVSGSDTNHYKFTGKERDAESGLDDFVARYYTSALGRFVIPDWSAGEDPVPYASMGSPQTLNLYNYVMNNPVNKTDPTGHVPQGSPGDPGCSMHSHCESDENSAVNPATASCGDCSEVTLNLNQINAAIAALNAQDSDGGGASQNQQTLQSLTAQIPSDVRGQMATAITDSDHPTADDKQGGFHEEYGAAGTDASGKWVVSRDKPGAYGNPDVAGKVTPSNTPVNQAVANSIVDPRVVFHVHPGGVTAKGNAWNQPPSAADRAAAVRGQTSIVFGARAHKVYFYNSSGNIGKPMKLKDFFEQ